VIYTTGVRREDKGTAEAGSEELPLGRGSLPAARDARGTETTRRRDRGRLCMTCGTEAEAVRLSFCTNMGLSHAARLRQRDRHRHDDSGCVLATVLVAFSAHYRIATPRRRPVSTSSQAVHAINLWRHMNANTADVGRRRRCSLLSTAFPTAFRPAEGSAPASDAKAGGEF